jgi:hypothetical protein
MIIPADVTPGEPLEARLWRERFDWHFSPIRAAGSPTPKGPRFGVSRNKSPARTPAKARRIGP